MSYLPSFLSISMRWSNVSEKYWNRAFCFCTSSPRMRFRNLVMEQSVGGAGSQATGVTLPTTTGSSSSQYSPFSTSKQPERDSRLPMPTDSRPCFMSVKETLTLTQGTLPYPLPRNPPSPQILISPAVVPTPPRHTHEPWLTPKEGGIPSWIALGQGHPVVRLAHDRSKDTAECTGAVL